MIEQNKIKQLATDYFEGNLSAENEKELFSYISESNAHLQHFRDWEVEWGAGNNEKTTLLPEWIELESKISAKQEATELRVGKRFFSLHGIWRYAAVAALMIFVAGATLFLNRAINNMKPTQYVMVEAPLGQKSKITLADGTEVWLNAGSTLKYTEQVKGKDFKVILSGEAYFDVAHQYEDKFKVETEACVVEVVGTKFNLTAYPDESYITTTLMQGKVNIISSDMVTEMLPGETVTLNKVTGELSKTYWQTANTGSWIDNDIIYDNISFNELSIKLARQYNVRIYLLSPNIADKKFNLSLRNNETVDDVMRGLEKILQVKIEKRGNEYYIREK